MLLLLVPQPELHQHYPTRCTHRPATSHSSASPSASPTLHWMLAAGITVTRKLPPPQSDASMDLASSKPSYLHERFQCACSNEQDARRIRSLGCLLSRLILQVPFLHFQDKLCFWHFDLPARYYTSRPLGRLDPKCPA
jgi:hypothetical protein